MIVVWFVSCLTMSNMVRDFVSSLLYDNDKHV